MKTMYRLFAVILLVLFLGPAGCTQTQPSSTGAPPHHPNPGDTVFQVSTFNALLQGFYDGQLPCGRLKEQGDLGIGTLHRLDGEMVVVDGQVFQVKADGKAYPVADEVTTPFASVTSFEADQEQKLTNIASFEQLQQQLKGMLTNPNLFFAIRVDGTFKYVKTRSVPGQEKPYPPLVEVTKNQPTFEFENIQGTLVGFWCPQYVEGINVTGYHLHFISQDRQVGGHLLECQLQEGTLQVDQSTDFHLALPTDETFGQADLAADRSEETEKVEK